eukprot:scaffold144582_cov15-Prasinocladus_malaysianus.AAC.1
MMRKFGWVKGHSQGAAALRAWLSGRTLGSVLSHSSGWLEGHSRGAAALRMLEPGATFSARRAQRPNVLFESDS